MKRIQNRIAESRFSLLGTAVYAFAVGLTDWLISDRVNVGLAFLVISTYLMLGMNNRNALIRIYSRMVSCSFLVLAMLAAATYGSIDEWIVQLCFILTYLALFSAYQDKRAQGTMFYAFMFIGIASLVFVQALFFVPVLWVLIATNLMAFSNRNFWASLIGLTLPYWFYGCYCAITGNIDYIVCHFAPYVWVHPLWQYECISLTQAVNTGFIILVTLIGSVHFLRTSYKDKIRTRMIYEMIITMSLLILVFMAFQPKFISQLTAVLTINASILIAHFFALTSTRVTNIAFYVLTLTAVGLTVFNLLV